MPIYLSLYIYLWTGGLELSQPVSNNCTHLVTRGGIWTNAVTILNFWIINRLFFETLRWFLVVTLNRKISQVKVLLGWLSFDFGSVIQGNKLVLPSHVTKLGCYLLDLEYYTAFDIWCHLATIWSHTMLYLFTVKLMFCKVQTTNFNFVDRKWDMQ